MSTTSPPRPARGTSEPAPPDDSVIGPWAEQRAQNDTALGPGTQPAHHTRNLIAIACVSVLIARLISAGWIDDVPHVMDEVTYDLQARMFALGRISGPELQPLAAFHQWFVEDRGTRHGIFPPGWPALLALGQLVGLPRWVNPILHGLTVLLLGSLGRRLRGPSLGTLCALLYGLCPQALLLAASVMSHTLCALLATLAFGEVLLLLCTPAAAARGEAGRAIGAGLALGWLAATRPLCAVVIGACCAAGVLACLWRRRVRSAHWLALPALALPIALLLAYNRALTGDALEFPQTHFFDTHLPPIAASLFRYSVGCNALGFGFSHGCEYTLGSLGHTLPKAAEHTLHNARASLALAYGGGCWLLAACVALATRETRRLALWLGAPLALVVPAYAAYWGVGTCYGARFYHVALPFGLLAAALGLLELRGRWRFGGLAVAGLALGAAVSFGVGVARAHSEISGNYWGTDARFVKLRDAYRGPPAVVLLVFRSSHGQSVSTDLTGTGVSRWPNFIRMLSAQAANAPLLDGPLVFGRYHPALVDAVRRSFPGRALLVYLMGDDPQKDALLPLERFRLNAKLEGTHPKPNFTGLVLRASPAQ